MKKLLKTSSYLATVAGIILLIGGLWGMCFTYKNVTEQRITTAQDSKIPNEPVRGPFTLNAQAEIIREHTLSMTGGKTYAEMPRQVEKLDENGNVVYGSDGKPVMVANSARDIWITATTLITALNLGILSYVFSGFVILFGLVSIWTGLTFRALSKKY